MHLMKKTIYQWLGHAALVWAACLVCVPMVAQNLTDTILLPAGTLEGRLGNGMRYILRKNAVPASRTEFRLIMHVGSVQETEEQKGGAHFLEHIAFGGTRHFPRRGAVEYLETLGMKYGQDINAYTGFDRTMYMFAVPSESQKADGYHKPLLILRDWLTDMTINPQRVETEKGIILEELRGYSLDDDFYDLKIGQGIFRNRMPLGRSSDISSMTSKTLRDFYRTWYVPELATLVVVGDIEPEQMEEKIRNMFNVKRPIRAPKLQTYPLVYGRGMQISRVADSLQMHDEVELMIPHPCVTTRTLEDVRRREMGNMLVNALNHRFRLLHVPCDVSNSWYLSDKEHLVFTVKETDGSDLHEGIASLANALNSALVFGFSDKEVERVAAISVRRLKDTDYMQGRPSAMWCDDMADYVLSGDAYVSDSAQVACVAEAVERITGTELQRLLAEWLRYRHSSMLVAARVSPGSAERLTEDFIRRAWSVGDANPVEAFVYTEKKAEETAEVQVPACLDTVCIFDDAMVESTREYPALGIREATLANGIRLVMKPTKEDAGVSLTMLAPGGLASIPDGRFFQLESTAGYMDLGGIAKADYEQLQDYMYRNDMALSLSMDAYWHGFMGSFTAVNANVFFNLMYEKITDPELRYADFEEIRDEQRHAIGRESILDKMLNRTQDRLMEARINRLMGNTLEREEWMTEHERVEAMNLDSIATFYQSLYNNAKGMTVILCGSFNPDSLLQQFAAVFSRLPHKELAEQRTAYAVSLPDSTIVERFDNDNETQTVFDCLYFGQYEPGLRNSLILKLMNALFFNRLISNLREKESLVYSPYSSLFYDGLPKAVYYFDINASVDNSNMEKVCTLLHAMVTELKEQTVTAEELNKLKQSFLINKREALDESNTAMWRTTLAGLIKNGESLEDFARYEECLDCITPEDIRAAFRQYVDADRFVLLYMSNQEFKGMGKK